MKVCRGFTLLELMVAIAVLAILVTIGVPSFQTLIQNNRVVTQTNELVTALNFARTEAVKRGRPVQVTVTNLDPGWQALVVLDPAGANETLRVFDREGSLVVVGTTADGIVQFSATGAPDPDGTQTFDLEPTGCSGKQRREVEIGISGQITTSKKVCGGG